MVNAIAHNHIKPPRLTKQGFVAGGAAAVADELGGDLLSGGGRTRIVGVLGERDGYKSGIGGGVQYQYLSQN